MRTAPCDFVETPAFAMAAKEDWESQLPGGALLKRKTAASAQLGPIQDSAKMGALSSFAAAIVALPLGQLLKVKSR